MSVAHRGTGASAGALGRALVMAAIVATGTAAGATGAAAQDVELAGRSDIALDRRLARLLRTDPLVITADRRIPLGDTVRGSVLVLDATVILEGTVTGDLVSVDGGVFVRHEAVVEGDLVNIAGGLYRSELARVGGTIIDLPHASYRVERVAGRFIIEATRTPSPLELDGFGGVRQPRYDRANGLSAVWGARYRLPRVRGITPWIGGHIGWRLTAEEPTYGARLELDGSGGSMSLGWDRGSATRDDWAVGDLRNTLNYVWDGDDYRNYYDAERLWVALHREFGDVAKRFHASARLAAQVEDATSLPGGDPWHIFGEAARPNPAIDDGRITSALGRLAVEWHGLTTHLEIGAEYEAGRDWMDGEHTFDRVTAWAELAVSALADHTLEIHAFGQRPVPGDTLPRQRWTLVGGPLTLTTVPTGAYRGDRALFVDTRYRIPAPRGIVLPLLGPPELQLVHRAGRAWLEGDDDALVQEIGARVQFLPMYVQYLLQPSDTARDALVVGMRWPFTTGFPWER